MDITELRVGNLISNNVECLLLSTQDFMFLLKNDNEHFAAPVPISESWLESMLFIKLSDEWALDGMVGELTDEGFIFTGGEGVHLSRPLKYIHQLQNLYHALTGEEIPLVLTMY